MTRLHDPSTGLVATFAFSRPIPFFSGLDEGVISVLFRDRSLSTVARIETKVFFFRPLPGLFDDLVLQQHRQLGAIRDVRPGDE